MDKAGVATDARVATDAGVATNAEETPTSGWGISTQEWLDKYGSRDSWGPCCPGCEWWGHATKPCAVCKGGLG